MKFWKKIVKTVKESPIAKGVSINTVSKLINKSASLAKDVSKLVGGKGRKGGAGIGGTGEIISAAKGIAQKLKSGSFSLGNKLTKTVKSLGAQKLVPNKRQVL